VLLSVADASAQSYRRDNRKGNRAFASGDFDKAMKHYEGSLAKDTVNTLPLLYNAAYTLHSDRRDSLQNMAKDSIAVNYLDRLAEAVVGTEYEHDYHFTKGVLAIDMKDWQKAMDEFKTCMIMDPNDMEARENYIYAKEHLSKDNGGGGGQDQQNQDQQNQDQQNQDQQNQDQQNQNQDQQNQDQQDQNQQDQQNQDQNKDQQGQQQNPDGQNESRISPQAAKQILQAMQAKERETQDKVEKKKAEALKSKQKEKNW
jgi:hypothetical protein